MPRPRKVGLARALHRPSRACMTLHGDAARQCSKLCQPRGTKKRRERWGGHACGPPHRSAFRMFHLHARARRSRPVGAPALRTRRSRERPSADYRSVLVHARRAVDQPRVAERSRAGDRVPRGRHVRARAAQGGTARRGVRVARQSDCPHGRRASLVAARGGDRRRRPGRVDDAAAVVDLSVRAASVARAEPAAMAGGDSGDLCGVGESSRRLDRWRRHGRAVARRADDRSARGAPARSQKQPRSRRACWPR